MNNIHLTILGSTLFSNIINELEFINILNSKDQLNHNDNKISVKILFTENIKVKEVKNLLLQNEPIILFLNRKDYIYYAHFYKDTQSEHNKPCCDKCLYYWTTHAIRDRVQ